LISCIDNFLMIVAFFRFFEFFRFFWSLGILEHCLKMLATKDSWEFKRDSKEILTVH